MKNMKKFCLFFGVAVVVVAMASVAMARNNISVQVRRDYGNGIQFPMSFALIKCEDLTNGVIKVRMCGFLGNCVFRFLPAHHDYKISDLLRPEFYDTVYDLTDGLLYWVSIVETFR